MKSRILFLPVLFGALCYAGSGQLHRNAAATATPAKMAERQTARIAQFFNLGPDQRSMVLNIMTNADTQTQSLRAQLKPLRANVAAEIRGNQPDQIKATMAQIAPLQQQMESIRSVAAAQIYAKVLTPPQQAQVNNGLAPLFGLPGHARQHVS